MEGDTPLNIHIKAHFASMESNYKIIPKTAMLCILAYVPFKTKQTIHVSLSLNGLEHSSNQLYR